MTAIACDGFDEYSDITLQWQISNAAVQIQSTTYRTGSQALVVGSDRYLYQQCDSSLEHATFILGIALYHSTGCIIQFCSDSNATIHTMLYIFPDGAVTVYNGNATVLATLPMGTTPINAWIYVEFKATLGDSGSYAVRVNGATIISGSGDTKNGGTKTVYDSFRIQGFFGGNAYVDDLVWMNGAGSANNDFLGDRRVITLVPNADGALVQWNTSTGSSHYVLVDEKPASTSDYIEESTNGDIDLFDMENLPAGSVNIPFVQVEIYAEKTDSATIFAQRVIRSGGTNYAGTSIALSNGSYLYLREGVKRLILETNPNGGGAWDYTTVNAVQVGVKVSTT